MPKTITQPRTASNAIPGDTLHQITIQHVNTAGEWASYAINSVTRKFANDDEAKAAAVKMYDAEVTPDPTYGGLLPRTAKRELRIRIRKFTLVEETVM